MLGVCVCLGVVTVVTIPVRRSSSWHKRLVWPYLRVGSVDHHLVLGTLLFLTSLKGYVNIFVGELIVMVLTQERIRAFRVRVIVFLTRTHDDVLDFLGYFCVAALCTTDPVRIALILVCSRLRR